MSITDRARGEAADAYAESACSQDENKPIARIAFIVGAEWAVSQPVTDEEVRAAAWAICRLQDDGYEPTEDHPCKACTEAARAALTAAREAQR
ncbi:hypothetical protein [Brachybacterium sp. NPDC056505]|uniref:hypothetical protein n=1 Tax=Brachybacterium sp. NPDC056505 TaxID=3345843 RepID=UPI003670BCAD